MRGSGHALSSRPPQQTHSKALCMVREPATGGGSGSSSSSGMEQCWALQAWLMACTRKLASCAQTHARPAPRLGDVV